jgi:hypothetical protein
MIGRSMRDAFRVSVGQLDYEYLVCVDGLANARWLLDRLADSFIFPSAKPIYQEQGSTLCSFQVPRSSLLRFSTFQAMLAAIPEVTLSKGSATD